MRQVFGDEVMAAALIGRLMHHCHLVTIRLSSERMRQHTELWQTLHAAQDPEPASGGGDALRLAPSVDLSDLQAEELSLSPGVDSPRLR